MESWQKSENCPFQNPWHLRILWDTNKKISGMQMIPVTKNFKQF